MKKLCSTIAIALLSLVSPRQLLAQCSFYATTTTTHHVHDTTFLQMVVSEDFGSVLPSAFTWTFSDGHTYTGSTITYPLTDIHGYTAYTVTGTTAGCAYTLSNNTEPQVVFNCDSLIYSQVVPIDVTQDMSATANVALYVDINPYRYEVWGGYPYTGDASFMSELHIDWGNGNSSVINGPTFDIHAFGGASDPAHPSGYLHGGQYTIRPAVKFSYDTLTCPIFDTDPFTIHVGGTNIPSITGSTSYCAGDTLRLTGIDTTVFHNMYHMAPTTTFYDMWANGVEPVMDNPWYVYYPGTFLYTWFDKDYNVVGHDTAMLLPNLTVENTGLYYLRVYDNYTGRNRDVAINVSVTGSTIGVDSISGLLCSDTSKMYIHTNRINDSVQFTYLKDGIPNTVAGWTDAAGKFVITGLTSGYYTKVQAHFVTETCGSNTVGPFNIHKSPTPVIIGYTPNICIGGTDSMTVAAGVAGTEILWSGPGGYTATGATATIAGATYFNAGSYYVTQRVPGCSVSDAATADISVVEAPVPVVSNRSICENASIGYISGSPVLTSSDTNIVNNHGIAVHAGTATITTTVVNACGSAPITVAVTVNPIPVTGTITGPSAICGTDTAVFHISVTGGHWSVGPYYNTSLRFTSANTDTNSLIGVALSTAEAFGAMAIEYYKTGANGCSAHVTFPVTVRGTSANDYTLSGTSVFTGDTLTMYSYPYYGYGSAGVWTATPSSVLSVAAPASFAAGDAPGMATAVSTLTATCGPSLWTAEIKVTDWLSTTIVRSGGSNYDIPTGEALAADVAIYAIQDAARDTADNAYLLVDGLQLYKRTPDGRVWHVSGYPFPFPVDDSGRMKYTGDGGPARLAMLGLPEHLTCDPAGNVYISDIQNGSIRKISTSGTITRFAGLARSATNYYPAGYTGDGGPATAARVYPLYLTSDKFGNIYFSDSLHNVIRKINTAGIISTVAGNGSNGYSGDGGPALAAAIGRPLGLAADTAGDIIVSTKGYLRKIDASGTITTIAGTTGGSISATTAMATAPLFSGSVAIDKQGAIFVNSDFIRKIEPSGNTVCVYGSEKRVVADSLGGNLSFRWFITTTPNLVPDDSGGVYACRDAYVKLGKPSVEIHASVDTHCGATPVLFTAQGHNTGDSPYYVWRKNGVVVATDTIRYHDALYTTGDTVTCTLYRRSGGLSLDTAAGSTVVDTTAPVSITIATVPDLCSGASASLTASPLGGEWHLPATTVASLSDGTITSMAPGSTNLYYTVTNACGSLTDSTTVAVISLPDAGTLAGDTSFCMTTTTTVVPTVAGGSWYTTSGVASVSAGTLTAISTGADTVLYIVSNSCGADTATHTIEVMSVPSAGAITGVDTLCAGETAVLTASATSGTWSSSSAAVASVTGTGTVTAAAAGTVVISYSVSNMCGAATATHTLVVGSLEDCTAGVDNTPTARLTIYPNPSTGTFTVELPAPVSNATITIADVTGKVITTLTTSQASTVVDISALPSATYLLTITNNGITYHNKVVRW